MEKLLNLFFQKYDTLENRVAIIRFLIYAAILIYIFQNDDKHDQNNSYFNNSNIYCFSI